MHNPNADLATVVADFVAEAETLYALLHDADTGYWTEPTNFKAWTVWDVVMHLHVSDRMAMASLAGPETFEQAKQTGFKLADDDTKPTNGPDLLELWHSTLMELAQKLAAADPDERFAWFGPGMKAKMFATARLMETWAHSWEVFDLMGVQKQSGDQIVHIATIGVRTFGWTFNNRQITVPEPTPYVALSAPSGGDWSWNDERDDCYVKGDAVEFCQVVTQVRNVADTQLQVVGEAAQSWMAIAQCFAGGPEDPPAPGTRLNL